MQTKLKPKDFIDDVLELYFNRNISLEFFEIELDALFYCVDFDGSNYLNNFEFDLFLKAFYD